MANGINKAKYNPNRMTPGSLKTRNRRIELLKQFPVHSVVRWKYGQGDLEVVGHDSKIGRVLTTSNGSYNPDELELIRLKK